MIYRMYAYWNNGRLAIPIANIIFTLSVVHTFQLYTIYAMLAKFFPSLNFIFSIGKIEIYTISIVTILLNLLLLYNKKQWSMYLDEFKNETANHRKVGGVLIISYIFGSNIIFLCTLFLLYR